MSPAPSAPERVILHETLLALGSRPDCRVFRNSVGLARDPKTGQHVQFGLVKGASDIIGLARAEPLHALAALERWAHLLPANDLALIRAALAPVGRFLALEVKSAKGWVRPEQLAFIEMVKRLGGIAGVVRSVHEALALVDRP